MANKTVSNLKEVTTVSTNDVLLVETATETLKVTKSNLLKEVNEQLNTKSNTNHTHSEYATTKYVDQEIEKTNTQLSQVESDKANNINYVYSKIKADGVTDDTPVLRSELNNLNENDCLITPKGKSLLNTSLLMGTFKNNVILDFSATEFIEGTETPALILKLTNSEVRGLFINGDRQHKVIDETRFGLDYLFKIDNGCKNIRFTGITKLINAPYCCIMWGQGISQIEFEFLHCEEIGEHVQYKTGSLAVDYDIDSVLYKNVYLKNIGINEGNATTGHFVQFFKVANDDKQENTGKLKHVVIDRLHLDNVNNTVEFCIFSCYNIVNCYVYNVSGNVDALISGGNIKNVCAYNSKFKRVFISNADLKSSEGIKLYNCEFDYVAHVNLVNLYDCCKFNLYFSSSSVDDGVLKDDRITFRNCIFNCNTTCQLQHIYNNVDMIDCEFNSTTTTSVPSSMINFGETVTSSDKVIRIMNCKDNAVNFNFLFSFRHANINAIIMNMTPSNRIRAAYTINSITTMNLTYKFLGDSYGAMLNDLDNAKTKRVINCMTRTGLSLDNYIEGLTQTTTIGDKTITIKNGLIQTIA